MPRKKITETRKKQRRRGNNEGTIYQRKDGLWCGQVVIGYKPDGKLNRKTLYGKSRQEVAIKIAKHSNEVFENGYTSVSASDAREFCVLYDDWFTTFKAPNISSQTQERYRNFIKNHFNPAFGTAQVDEIDLKRFQRFFNEKAKNGYAIQTIKHMKQALSQFYEYAVKRKLVSYNPIADVKIQDNRRRDEENEKMALTPKQREIIFAALEKEELLKPILMILTFTGLRPQELIALRWRNIDFKELTISVTTAINRNVLFDDDGNVIMRNLVIGKTKTAGSVRSFIAPSTVMDCLKKWKEQHLEYEQKTGITFTADDCFVFSTQTGTMRTYNGLRSLLDRFIKRVGLDGQGISLYTFRHTFATILLEKRENPKIVSKLMGHAKVTTTLAIYSHVISNDIYETTAKTLDGVYSGITKKKNPKS